VPPTTTKKQQLLTVDLKGLKPLVLEAAHCANQRPSAWAREVIARALDAVAPKPAATAAANLTNHHAPKLTLRLAGADHERLGQLAQAEGVTRSQWLLHRLRQPNAAVIPKEHIDVLVKSNYELAGLGRNLNQVARSLNAYPGRTTAAEREAIAKAVAAVRAHLEVAANIIESLPQRTRARKPSA
jgi:hypothetical protein